MKLSAPTTLRAVANAFLAYRDDLGIDSVLDVFDWSLAPPRQIYHAILDRPPEAAEAAIPPPGFHGRELAHNALHSSEFQLYAIELMLRAFSEKRRLIFIHVPKCAGVDLTGRLSQRYPVLHQGLSEPAWTGPQDLFRALHRFTTLASNADGVVYTGHIALPWVLEKRYLRFDDDIFTVVRDPLDRAMSKINYVIETLSSRGEDPLRPDRLDWLGRLGYPQTEAWAPQESLGELAGRILRDPGLVTPNAICTLLGEGDVESAIDAVARADIEITDLERYETWMRRRWGEAPSARLNPSTRTVRREDLTAEDRDRLEAISEQDSRLYRVITTALAASREASVRGVEVARRAAALGLAA